MGLMRVLTAAGAVVPLAQLLPSWWRAGHLDALTMLSYLACVAAPLPFGYWLNGLMGHWRTVSWFVIAGFVLAAAAGAWGYWGNLAGSGAPGAPPAVSVLVVPVAQLFLLIVSVMLGWLFEKNY
jgi:hypothetical protein